MAEIPLISSRARKRLMLLERVRKQLEFYFCDANLNKDRFLQEKLKESQDGFIALTVLMTFNRLRELTTDQAVVREAIKSSSLLMLSTDSLRVKRTIPLSETGPVDEKILYVENLPENADVDWVRGKFSAFGPVQYVSVPRYKTNRKIKGFAFVEFDAVEPVDLAVKYFTPTTTDQSEIYDKEAALPVVPTVTEFDFEAEDLSAQHGHKRKRDEVIVEDDAHDVPPVATVHTAYREPSSVIYMYDKAKKPAAADTADKAKANSKKELDAVLCQPLKVMPKIAWIALRTRYLDMQKASYRALKQKLKILSVSDDQTGTANMEAELESDEDQEMDMRPRSDHRRNVIVKPVAVKNDVIIHLTTSKPAEDKKKVIADLRAIPHVIFVDVASERDVFVRCDTPENTIDVMGILSTRDAGNVIRRLEGEEEKKYWEKISANMETRAKSNKYKSKGQVRGNRDELDLIAKAENRTDRGIKNSHIIFDS